MSFWDIEPEDWFRRRRRLFGGGGGRKDIFGQFDEMRKEMQKMFEEQFKDLVMLDHLLQASDLEIQPDH